MTIPLKVVMTPCLCELMTKDASEEEEMEHIAHFSSLLNYLSKLNVEFDLYEEAPYFPDAAKRPPISRYHYHNTSCSNIYAKIQRKISYAPLIELNETLESKIITEYVYPEESDTKISFLRYITYLYVHEKDYLLFIGKANKDKPRPIKFLLPNENIEEKTPIYTPEVDCSGQLSIVFPLSNHDDIFPNYSLCMDLNTEYQKNKRYEDRISYTKEIGAEVASRNGYTYDNNLSTLNSQKQKSIRCVFKKFNKTAFYLSLDFESGGFEVFDYKGTHLGQYSFSGQKVKPAAPKTHKLYFS